MVERALAESLSADQAVRGAALQRLMEEEKATGFFPLLLSIYENSQVPMVKLQAILLLKNSIDRRWSTPLHSSGNKSCLSAEDKQTTKEALLRHVLTESTEQLSAQLIVAVTHIAKHDFPEKWWDLANVLLDRLASPQPIVLRILHAVLKVQLSKRLPAHKTAMAKVAAAFAPLLGRLWAQSEDLVVEKLLLLVTCFQPSRETFLSVLQRPGWQLARRRHVTKAIRSLLACAPSLFEDQHTLSVALRFILSAFEAESDSSLIEQAADCLTAMLLAWKLSESNGSPASTALSQCLEMQHNGVTQLELLLKRLLDVMAAEDRWQLWRAQEYEQFFNEDDGEESHIHKLLETLFLAYPQLTFRHIPDLLAGFATFSPAFQQAVVTLLGLLPRFLSELHESIPISLVEILQRLDAVQAQGFDRLVLLKGAAWLIRKWLDLVPRDFNLLPLLKQIKDNSQDLVVMYECCLTLKQMLYKGFNLAESGTVLSHFAVDIMQILSSVRTPQVVWHLIMLISALIEKSAYEHNETFLAALTSSAVPALLQTSSEIVLCALCDMFEHLIYSSSEVPFIVSLVCEFIAKQLSSNNENIEMLWHFAVANIEASQSSLQALCQLLPGLSYVTSKGVYFKLLEEYLLLHKVLDRPVTELLAFITSSVLPGYVSESNFDESTLMSLLETISLLDAELLVPFQAIIMRVLASARNDVYDSAWAGKAVVLLDKLILRNVQRLQEIPLELWLRNMQGLKHPNQRKINAAALMLATPVLPCGLVTAQADMICRQTLPFVENYVHSLDRVAAEEALPPISRPKYTQLAPSTRKIRAQREESCQTLNLLALFKDMCKALQAQGTFLETWLADSELQTQFHTLQGASLHGRSSSS